MELRKSAMESRDRKSCTPQLLVITDEAPYLFHRDNVTQELKMEKRDASGQQTGVKLLREIYLETKHFCALIGDESVDDDTFDECARRVREVDDKVQLVRVPIRTGLLSNNLKNAQFWPVYVQMDEKIEHLPNEDEAWKASKEVNKRFSEAVLEAVEEEHQSIVWIQDFRFWLAPKLVRQMLVKKELYCPIGTFIHIPFPPMKMLQKLKHYKEVLEGILGSDVICFHIKEFCTNFIECCEMILGCQVNYESLEVHYNGRKVTLHAIPVGIKYDLYANLSCKEFPEDCHDVIEDLYNDNADHKIIIGVDRLDYAKGLGNRVKAFQRLLEKHPEHDGKVQYLQVAVPVREGQPGFKHLKEEYEKLVSRTNAALQKKGFSSKINVVLENVPHHDLPVYYKRAHVGLVTPYRDALNLVSLEYVASQTSDPGVLVLSNYAGSAEFMHEALKVDPKNVEQMADTLHRALTMPKQERQTRMIKLRQRVKKELNIDQWVELNMEVLLKIKRINELS
ncbi:alpha,alpha-trehalose-phosphate synthase [UDP-forming]-like [Actinia tenebrosa]|uniref:Alpha,alpha-trehalose-phosphate synthase [UDP-forming]-like n=1 Tax=Actinia tenebrosa TaxID=6105 RepID=A0A6P8IIM2_ACTTE|nr:alpha,alpha-trehalose-phosphate synthase [UDP-forming]-like [Actinia tenebrosa]